MLIREIAEAHEDVVRDVGLVDGVQAAATFGGLMLLPELQANHLRLQALVHLSISDGSGLSSPDRSFVQSSFERLGQGWAGVMEDPSEDVFSAVVQTDSGNFRLREGICEGATFHLQRVLNVMAGMPRGGRFTQMHSSVEALLKLSDAVIARAGLSDYQLGDELPKKELSPQILTRLDEIAELVHFTDHDLLDLGICRDALADFAYDLSSSAELRDDDIFHTRLQRRPVLFRDSSAYFLLPIATGAAVTRYVVESVSEMNQVDVLESAIVAEYARLFRESPLLGEGPNAPIYFQKLREGGIAAAINEVDCGRFLQLILFVEGLEGFAATGYSGTRKLSESSRDAVQFHLNTASEEAARSRYFKEGITLVVFCGLGRRIAIEPPSIRVAGWTVEALGAWDFDALCWIPGFDALSLIRLAAATSRVESEGVAILNASGLLNLVAWTRQLGGHLVPHGIIPEDFATGGPKLIAIEQNALRQLRHDVLTTFDPRRVLDVSGKWAPVRREARSLFEEHGNSPLYFSEDAMRKGRLRSVYVSACRPYWAECVFPDIADRESAFQHFEMICAWVRRAACVFDEALTELRHGPIEFRVHFSELRETGSAPQRRSEADLRALIHTRHVNSTAEVHVDAGFDDGLGQPDNVAERLLVEAMVAGVSLLAQPAISSARQAALVNAICPSDQARSLHFFVAQTYRDFIPQSSIGTPILVDDIDSAMYRFGLGWKARSIDCGTDIRGVDDCKTFLNSLVMIVLDDLCAGLKTFNREQLIRLLLHNHEAVECDRARWRRTARANIAMHDDHEGAVATIVRRESRLTAASMACRILMEAAICECPEVGGLPPGIIDLTRLMAQALIAYHWGGYSDVIHWGAAEAHLQITPLGDVHFDPEFIDTIYEPFGRTGSERQVMHAAAAYPDHFVPPTSIPTVATVMDAEFLSAWESEFGASVDQLRLFFDLIEDDCRSKGNEPVAILTRDTCIRLLMDATGREAEAAGAILGRFVLEARPSWRVPGAGFSNKDWFPWRFRRRYATVRAPFLQLGRGDNPELAFAPGLARHAFVWTVGAYHRAEIPQLQVTSAAMRAWLGSRNHRHRLAFNKNVAQRMAELGWKVKPEMTLPALIGRRLERDYGDVDVVAWNPDSGRVLMMECKDLQFHRAMGEVAEQLHDFRGELLPDGKPDLLKKHLDRVDKAKAFSSEVVKTLKIRGPIGIEGHIVFKNPVPMKFAAKRLASKIRVSLFDELDRL
jgi:hypothetical protein